MHTCPSTAPSSGGQDPPMPSSPKGGGEGCVGIGEVVVRKTEKKFEKWRHEIGGKE